MEGATCLRPGVCYGCLRFPNRTEFMMMELGPYWMFRVVTEDLWSDSILPRKNQHTQRGLLFAKGEIVQLVGMRSPIYFAKPIADTEGAQPTYDKYEAYLYERQFRELTPEERAAFFKSHPWLKNVLPCVTEPAK